MSQLREYIEKHPSETQRVLGIDYDQLIGLIINAENLYDHQKKYQESQKTRIIKPGKRPTDYQAQKKTYSGKQKRHTLKNQVIVMPSGKEIVDVVVGETGATVDIKIWRKQRASLDPSQRFQGDKAYVGEPLINTPHKKPREEPLTPAQKRANKAKAKKRIFVEHLIRLLKIFRVAAERFRLKRQNYEPVILVVCGLIRWRIGALVMCQ